MSLKSGLPLILFAAATPALAAEPSARHQPSIVVIGERRDNTPEKLDHIMPEVAGTKVTVTKKTSITRLDLLPTIVDNNQRQLFSRTPGLFVSEQQTGTQFNLSYRGLGNPQESEYVLVMQDGIPLEADWIGFPTLYAMPFSHSIADIQ